MGTTYEFKSILAGAGGVGKTALLSRHMDDQFTNDYKMTIGLGFRLRTEKLPEDITVRHNFYDFAGEDRFRFLLPDYCNGASGALVCYDVTDYTTFEAIPEWLQIIRDNTEHVPVILVGNKWDLDNHEVDIDVAEKYAEAAGCICNVMCSAKLDLNVNELFTTFTQWLIHYENNR